MDQNGIGFSMMLLVRIMKMDESNRARRGKLSAASYFPGTDHGQNHYFLCFSLSFFYYYTYYCNISVTIDAATTHKTQLGDDKLSLLI